MAWLPYERLIIETSLNPAEAHASLAQVVAPELPTDAPFVGVLSGERFAIRRAVSAGNPFVPEITGTLHADPTGTAIDLTIRMRWLVLLVIVVLFVALSFVEWLLLRGAWQAGTFQIAQLAPLGVAVLLLALCALLYGYQVRKARDLLHQLFAD